MGGLDDFLPSVKAKPKFNAPDGSHQLSPDDLAVIYDIAPLYGNGIDGTGQSLVIVGESRANPFSDVAMFRGNFNLAQKAPTLILVPGYPDPGTNETGLETALDLEWAGAIARNASITYVYSTSAINAVAYAVDQNFAPVIMPASCSDASRKTPPPLLSAFQSIAQQANVQGITWINGSGDSGAAGCDPQGSPLGQNGEAVALPGGIPEVTSVGGSQFDDSAGA